MEVVCFKLGQESDHSDVLRLLAHGYRLAIRGERRHQPLGRATGGRQNYPCGY